MFNNRTAPRFNARKFRKNIISEELYIKWKEQTGLELSFQEFKNIWNLIGDAITDGVTEERDGVALGASTGDLYIGYVPTKKRPIDYKVSLQYEKAIKHENWNSSNKVGKIIYGTHDRKYIYRLSAWWAFKASRLFKNKVSAALTAYPQRYKNTIEKRK